MTRTDIIWEAVEALDDKALYTFCREIVIRTIEDALRDAGRPESREEIEHLQSVPGLANNIVLAVKRKIWPVEKVCSRFTEDIREAFMKDDEER